jgi:ATP-dependent DNA helicase PIF1
VPEWTPRSPTKGSSQADITQHEQNSQSEYQRTQESGYQPSQPLSEYGTNVNLDSSQRVSRGRALHGRSDPGPAQRARQANIQAMLEETDPVIDSTSDLLEQPALNKQDWAYLQAFHERMEKEHMEQCTRCDKKWYNLALNRDHVCYVCVKADKDLDTDMPFQFSADNEMDLGLVPTQLTGEYALTQVEEMLIARVHCFVEVRQVRGSQFRYRGHVVNFLNNTGKVYDCLLLLPSDLDIIIIRPAGYKRDLKMRKQFRKDFCVRKHVVRWWLEHLKQHHEGYRTINVAWDNLDALPDDAFVDDELIIHEIADEDGDGDPSATAAAAAAKEMDIEDDGIDDKDRDDYEPPEVGTVPELHADNDEVTEIRAELGRRGARQIGRQPRRLPSMSLPTPRNTPISEFNKSHPLLSWAFPSLFPYGRAEYVSSRPREVDYKTYIKHLLLHCSGRFAQHPRFCYVVFNTLMRIQVNTKSSFFVRKLHPEQKDLSIDDLRAAFEDDSGQSDDIVNSITRYAGSLRGTRPYWNGNMKGLEAMVRQLKCTHAFITNTPADYHWDSLQRQLPGYDKWLEGNQKQRLRQVQENVRDNPLIVAYHFHRRLGVYMQEVLEPKFNITDYWHHFEWQARGSTHSHGLFWIDGAPSATDLVDAAGNVDNDLKQELEEFWAKHATGFNPEPNSAARPHEESPMMQEIGTELRNNALTLSQLVNRVQRHVCTESYCLRLNKKTNVRECRFYFPDDPVPRDNAEIKPHSERSWLQYYPPRNDAWVNKYSRLLSMAWQANMDISPCTSMIAVIEYIVKYAAKYEKKSESYKDLAGKLIPFVNENQPFQSLVTKLMNKLVGERDYSAQEVCHMLLDLPLYHSSREVITVDLRPLIEQPHVIRIEQDETRRGKTRIEHFLSRPKALSDLNFITFLRSYSERAPYSKRRGKDQVLSFFPRYRPDEVEDYGRVKLMLHHPFHKFVDELKNIRGIHDRPCDTWAEA